MVKKTNKKKIVKGSVFARALVSQPTKTKKEGLKLLKKMRSRFPSKRHTMRKLKKGYSIYSYQKAKYTSQIDLNLRRKKK
jgi:hypothetical protein